MYTYHQKWTLLILSFEVYTLKSSSRYTLDTEYVDYPLPLDICMRIGNDNVIYSCDTTSTPYTLIKSNHTSHALCNSSNPITSYQTHDSSTPPFHCIGQNNYILLHEFENDKDCSDIQSENNNNNYIASYRVTNVCHSHIHYSCNEYYAYYDSECDTSSPLSTKTYISPTTCNNHRRIMVDCIENDESTLMYNDSTYLEDSALFDLYFTLTNYTQNALDGCSYFTENNTDIFCGIQRDEESYITSITFEDVHLYHGLPSTICHLKRLSVISVSYVNIADMEHSSTLPQCIHSDLPLLTELRLVNTNLNGSIESILIAVNDIVYLENNPYITGSIPSNVCNLTTFHLVNMTQINGVIPECIFSFRHDTYSYFHIASTALSGSIPRSICNARFLYFRLYDNPWMTGTIPGHCDETKLIQFTLIEMDGLTGRIPDWVFCDQSSLEWMDIRNTQGLMSQTIPSCFADAKPFLETLILSRTSLEGVFPSLPFSLRLSVINIAHNKFDGVFSDLFANYMDINPAEIINDLWCLLVHNNRFVANDDLAETLQFIWSQWSLELFSIANNPNITGSIPVLQTDTSVVTHSARSVFMAHNCDIHGVIPSGLQMPHHLQWFTLFDNRLSGAIPDNIGEVNTTALTSLVLTGNILYSTNSDSLPSWMRNSPFRNTSNLYSATFQQMISIMLVFVSVLGIIVTVFSQIKHLKAKQSNFKSNREERDSNPFFGKIEFIYWKYGSAGMLFWIIFLLIFYPINARYYEYVKLESLFTLNWYHDDNKWMDVVLCLASIGFQLVILNMIIKVLTRTNDFNEDHTSDIIRSESCIYEEEPQEMTKIRKCYTTLLFILHLMIYIAGSVVICSYFVILSLPEDNMLRINDNVSSIMAKSMALFLMLFNKYAIRNLVRSFVVCMEYENWYRFQQKSIIIIHFINCVIIPFIAAVVLLQNCGRHWVLFWNQCTDTHLKEAFDVSVPVANDRYHMEFDVLSSGEICDAKGLWSANMNWNKCIRSFFYNWSFVILYKVLYEIISSLLGLFWRLLKLKMCPCIKSNRKWRLDIGQYNIKFMTNLIISITFSFYSPLIIPIYLMGVILIKYLHKVMMNRYGMTLHTPCNMEDGNFYYLPVRLIIFGVIADQLSVLLFLSFCVYNLFPATMFCVASVIMDYAVIKNIRIYNQTMQRMDTHETPDLPPSRLEEQQRRDAKKMLNISRKKLSSINEDEEQFDNETQVEIVVNGEDGVAMANATELEVKAEDETDMKSYQVWVREMKEKMKSTASYSSAQSVTSNCTPVPYAESMGNSGNFDNFIQSPNMHQTQSSASESQHYTIELSKNPEKKANQDEDQDV